MYHLRTGKGPRRTQHHTSTDVEALWETYTDVVLWELTAWLLEELGLDYEIRFADRMSNLKAPEDFKGSSGHPLGKLPSLKDGDHTVYESGVITECVRPCN
jgi:glutathione S-transferase